MSQNQSGIISVVVCTRNRPEMLARCLQSLSTQNGSFEVIIVDQGDTPILPVNDPRFRVVPDKKRGLSAGRNAGIQAATGDTIVFIDDDATVDSAHIETLHFFLSQNPHVAGIAGRVLVDSTGMPYAKTHKGNTRRLALKNWMTMLGGNFAFRHTTFETIGPFDERFGAGVSWASGEESDYFFRMLEHEMCVMYIPQLIVYHPIEATGHTSASLKHKLYHYGKGHGALFSKHFRRGNQIMFWYWLWSLCKPTIRIIQFALFGNITQLSIHLAVLRGRAKGFFEYTENTKQK